MREKHIASQVMIGMYPFIFTGIYILYSVYNRILINPFDISQVVNILLASLVISMFMYTAIFIAVSIEDLKEMISGYQKGGNQK